MKKAVLLKDGNNDASLMMLFRTIVFAEQKSPGLARVYNTVASRC